ncbi:hypothetical protein GGR52DRAFT_574312 [Hypoxylon sp. FL1284]|nr:hypothetical protein GGR52DRAFT_574312 [Hypoxylon sp. FL1284]
MKTASVLSVLATTATLASANGVIDLFSQKSCGGSVQSGSYTPPKNCNGGCVSGSWESARQVSADSGYIFTVYTDKHCSKGKKAVKGCTSGNWKSFSYDCGS